jgi:hypothetical protein
VIIRRVLEAAGVEFIDANGGGHGVRVGERKVRWSKAGSGKRGGVRVIYFHHDANQPLYLLLVYAKAAREDLSADEKRTVRKLAAVLKGKGRQKEEANIGNRKS